MTVASGVSGVSGVHVAVPTHDGRIDVDTMMGIIDMIRVGITISLGFGSGAWLPQTRNQLVAEYLEGTTLSHLLCVDSDIVFRAADVNALLRLDVDFAFGRCAVRRFRGGPTRVAASGLLGQVGPHVQEWERCGAGFMLLRRAAVERLVAAAVAEGNHYITAADAPTTVPNVFGTRGWVDIDGVRCIEAEDFAFCRRWRELGGRIYTDDRVNLGHVGKTTYRIDPAPLRRPPVAPQGDPTT